MLPLGNPDADQPIDAKHEQGRASAISAANTVTGTLVLDHVRDASRRRIKDGNELPPLPEDVRVPDDARELTGEIDLRQLTGAATFPEGVPTAIIPGHLFLPTPGAWTPGDDRLSELVDRVLHTAEDEPAGAALVDPFDYGRHGTLLVGPVDPTPPIETEPSDLIGRAKLVATRTVDAVREATSEPVRSLRQRFALGALAFLWMFALAAIGPVILGAGPGAFDFTLDLSDDALLVEEATGTDAPAEVATTTP